MFARGLAMALAAEGSAERATLPAGPIAPEGVNKPLRVDKAVEALQREPGWDGDPGVRLIAASALAARGEGPKAREWAASVRDGAFDPQWTSYADALLGGSGVDVRAKARRTVTASAVGSETTLDGRLDETDWRVAKPLAISPVGDEKTALRGVVRLLRSPSHLLVGLELPREQKRSWEVDLAMDTDRDAATQIVVTFDSAGEKAVTFRSRFAPPMPLPSRPIRLQGRKSDRAFTFELAVPLKLMGQSPQRPGEWNLQIRATAWQRGRTTELYLEPLWGGLDALHRYSSLKLPAPKRADRENRNDR
jgi:hypothetical protein